MRLFHSYLAHGAAALPRRSLSSAALTLPRHRRAAVQCCTRPAAAVPGCPCTHHPHRTRCQQWCGFCSQHASRDVIQQSAIRPSWPSRQRPAQAPPWRPAMAPLYCSWRSRSPITSASNIAAEFNRVSRSSDKPRAPAHRPRHGGAPPASEVAAGGMRQVRGRRYEALQAAHRCLTPSAPPTALQRSHRRVATPSCLPEQRSRSPAQPCRTCAA